MQGWFGDGYLTDEPKLKTFPAKNGNGDSTVVNFRIAVNDKRDKDTLFINCEAWGSGAETIAKYFKKGDLIDIESAKLVRDEWTDAKTGQPRTDVRLKVRQFSFPNPPKRREADASPNEAPDAGEQASEQEAPDAGDQGGTPESPPSQGRSSGGGRRGKSSEKAEAVAAGAGAGAGSLGGESIKF